MFVRIQNPKHEDVFTKQVQADEFGGVHGAFELEDEAQLGSYSITLNNMTSLQFRVEEYKKPEFEVTVSGPEKPIALGQKVQATISAKYYFGAPVTNAKVKYKVYRTSHESTWYPYTPWDWLYGAGYWWFSYNYDWYPGWRKWGLYRSVSLVVASSTNSTRVGDGE